MQVQRWLVLEKTYGAKLAPFQYMQLPKKPRFSLVSPSSQSLPIRIFHKPQPWLSRTARDARPAPEAIHISRLPVSLLVKEAKKFTTQVAVWGDLRP